MHWIEQFFHVYSDGGNGSIELLFLLLPLMAFLVCFVARLWLRRR
jgi:hypothetical protein